jgi:quercetin dioxygenase-like cupin family protein
MLFEETAPAGTETTFHLHRDSDEVAWVLSGEITFKIGDEVTVGGPGTCAFMPRGVPHAWKSTSAETGRVLFLYTPAKAGGFFEERLRRPEELDSNGAEANQMRRRHGWDIIGPPPL